MQVFHDENMCGLGTLKNILVQSLPSCIPDGPKSDQNLSEFIGRDCIHGRKDPAFSVRLPDVVNCLDQVGVLKCPHTSSGMAMEKGMLLGVLAAAQSACRHRRHITVMEKVRSWDRLLG